MNLNLILFCEQVISLLGGFTIAILDFILPPLLHLRIVCYRAHSRLPLVPLADRLHDHTTDCDIELPRRLTTNIPFQETFSKEDSTLPAVFCNNIDEWKDSEFGGNGNPDSSESFKDNGPESNTVPIGGPVKRIVVLQDVILLCVGSVVCAVSTVLSVISIYEKLTSGQAC